MPARLRLAHDLLVAEAAVAPQQGRPQVARQTIDERPQAWRAVSGRMLVAGRDVDIEHKTRRGHRIGVMPLRMRDTPPHAKIKLPFLAVCRTGVLEFVVKLILNLSRSRFHFIAGRERSEGCRDRRRQEGPRLDMAEGFRLRRG
jgi:hypothetical protein